MQEKSPARNKIKNAAGVVPFVWGTADVRRPLQNGTFCPISASGSNFNPRNIQYIPVVEIFVFLEREQKLPFFKGLVSCPGLLFGGW